MAVRSDFDVIVVGAGHNGLVCAAYLARAGYRVLVLERRPVVGGAAATEELFPGYWLDVGSVVHVLIRLTPILDDLELHKFGLEYLELDPWAFAPFRDGHHLLFYRDLDRTCASIEKLSPVDAQAYRDYVTFWTRVNQALLPAFLSPPHPGRLGAAALRGEPGALAHLLGIGPTEVASRLLQGYGPLLRHTFASDYVRGPLAQLSATAGAPPDATASANLLGWHALWHQVGVWRPRGGSGALARALVGAIIDRGGTVETGREVQRILVREGRVQGVRLASGETITGRAVVSAAHVQTTLLEMVEPGQLSGELRRRVEHIRVANGIGMTVQGAADALPDYLAKPGPGDHQRALQILCPSVEHLERAYAEARLGRPPSRPSMYVLTPTAVDPTLAPPGRHTLYVWGQFYPYRLADGLSWDDLRDREADRLLSMVAEYAPNVRSIVSARWAQSPLDLERRLGLRRGHCMHLDMTLDQMFMFRPLPELAGYRTPVRGLYLTGASTHPIGGVTGMPGYNAARVMLADLQGVRRYWALGLAGLGIGMAAGLLHARRRGRAL